MPVFGLNIANGTTVTAISGITLTLSTATLGAVSGTATFTAPLPYYSNTYTGDTVVNQGTLQFGNAQSQLGGIFVPGNLVLNNANAQQLVQNGSIASTSNVTLNGGSTLTLLGNNTLQSITFNNNGGTAASLVTGGTILLNGTVAVTNDNYATTPTIASNWELNGVNKTITASGASPVNLAISGAIQNVMGNTVLAGITKEGAGSLALNSATSSFGGAVNLNTGSLIIGAASTPNTVGLQVTAGPLGTGTLNIAGGTTILTDGTARTVANNVVANGNFTIGGASATTGSNLTLNGNVNFGAGARTISVTNPQATATINGLISNGTGLTKIGDGTLVLAPQTPGALSATGAASNATVAGNNTLTLNAAVAAGVVAGQTVHGIGIAPGTTVVSVAGSAVTLSQAAITTNNAGTFAFGNAVSLSATVPALATTITVSPAQAATLVLGSTVTGSGIAASTTITAIDTGTGVVTLNNATTSTLASLQNLTFSGAAAANSFNTYTGTTEVSGGLLKFGTFGAIPATSPVSVLSGGTLDINGGGSLISLASLASATNTTGGLVTTSATTGITSLFIGNANTSTGFGGSISNNVGSTLNVVKLGTGDLTLGGPNSYSGSTTINNGNIISAANNSLPATTAVTINNTVAAGTSTLNLNNFTNSIASLTFGGASATSTSTNNVQTGTSGTLTLLGNVTYDATNNPNGSTILGSGFVSLGGTAAGTGLPGAANRTFAVGDSSATDDLTVNATISNGSGSAGDSITKTGAGKLVFTAVNTYTGTTVVSAGTLQIGNGTTGSIDASSAVSTVSGATLAVNLANNSSLTNAIANQGTVNATGANTNTLSGIISGTGAVTQSGTGTTILTNANTYSGTTTVSNGRLHFTTSQTNTAAINVGEASGSLGTYVAATNSFTSQNAAVLSAADAVTLGSGSSTVTVGSGGVGILAPGASLGSDNGRLNINKDLVVNSGSMLQVGITTPTVATAMTFVNGVYTFNSSDYSTAGDLFNPDFGGAGANSANAAAAAAIWNVAPSSSSNHDSINVAGALTLSVGSKVHVLENGTMTYGFGQVFNLLDWGSFSSGLTLGTGFSSGGVVGDLYLPDLSLSGFAWDTSAFATHGILVVVPEPSRAFFILLGLLGLMMRRRRRAL